VPMLIAPWGNRVLPTAKARTARHGDARTQGRYNVQHAHND
jgi:hypothetical protein